MNSNEIRERFLRFFEKRGHTIIPSASLVPENDPSALFNTAGMQPLVPYLLGEKHPSGSRRLVNSQKCVRTTDIDSIGDNTHATFFEMLGNWSLGDPEKSDGIGAGYFKKEAIGWSFEFLTNKEEGLGLDPRRLYVTVFGGNEDAPKDTESYEIWKKLFADAGISGERIYYMVFADDGKKEPNWWSPGENGPCGPDSEMFYDITGTLTEGMTKEEYLAADERQDVVEIWNDVFMEYEKKNGKVVGKLRQKNVDTGSGLERVTMILQGKNNIYDTDLLAPIIADLTNGDDLRAKRIIADHIRTAVFMILDGVIPSNTDRGYILRRLIRRAVRFADKLEIHGKLLDLSSAVLEVYGKTYPNLRKEIPRIKSEIGKEEEKFRQTLERGMKEFEKISAGKKEITGAEAFGLFSSYGFPFELTQEIARERGILVGEGYEEELKKHREISSSGSDQKFKGGLGDTGEVSVRYHTATHLLHKALREVLGEHVFQKGSNITPDRMRFDFSHSEKMTDEEKKRAEDIVNEKIKEALPVSYEDVPIEEARARNAMGLFGDKYGATVRVYSIGDFSKEICGGPHVANTSELGHFKIVKEEAVAQGIRRIKAMLE